MPCNAVYFLSILCVLCCVYCLSLFIYFLCFLSTSFDIWDICIFISLVYLFYKLFFFNWRIIALQNFVVFYWTSTWISHRYLYIPSLLNLPPHPTPLGWYRAPVKVSWTIEQIPVGCLFYIWQCKFPCSLSIHLTLSPPSPQVHKSVLFVYFSIAAL